MTTPKVRDAGMNDTTSQSNANGVASTGVFGFSPGEDVQWLYTPRGGWCIPMWVRATVVRVGPKRVRIAATLKSGGTKETSVLPENLRHRQPNSDVHCHSDESTKTPTI